MSLPPPCNTCGQIQIPEGTPFWVRMTLYGHRANWREYTWDTGIDSMETWEIWARLAPANSTRAFTFTDPT